MTKTADKTLDWETQHVLALLEKHRDLIGGEQMYQFCRDWTDLKFSYLGGKRAVFLKLLMRVGARHPRLTLQRLRHAVPSISTNRAFHRLHEDRDG